MNTFESTEQFDAWLRGLKDRTAKAKILNRIDSAILGNFGDCKPVGSGVSEMRIHWGPGYRVYFTQVANVVYMLLAGGDKSSQQRNIIEAVEMAQQLKRN